MIDAVGVTGESGFIGSHLCKKLGDRALPLDLKNSSDQRIRELLEKTGCQTIVHLASPMYNKSKLEPISPKTSCEGLTLRLLDIIETSKPFNLIFLSSIRLHPHGTKVFSVESPIDPIDAYGKDKKTTERLLMNSSHKVFCIRASSVQGIDSQKLARGVLGTFARQAKQEGIIKVMGNGKSVKDLLHVSDLCDLIIFSITHFETFIGRILPVGGDCPTSLLDLAHKVQFHTKAEIEHIKADPFDLSGEVNNSSIFGLSDWRPIQTIDEMIKEALESVGNETVEI